MMHFKTPETKWKINDNIETQKALDIELKKKNIYMKRREYLPSMKYGNNHTNIKKMSENFKKSIITNGLTK
jgi:hypothetical protein